MKKVLKAALCFVAKSLWVSFLVLISALLVIVALVFISKSTSGDAAAWTQAVGSVVAIFSAIYIASRQSRHQIELAKKIADEKSVAQAARLYFIAKEYSDSVLSVVDKDVWVVKTDNIISVTFTRMLNRINSNFDDDLDIQRNEQIHVLRTQLTALIFALDNSGLGAVENRASLVGQLQEQAPKVREACLNLLRAATPKTGTI
ncbi:MULTISPECIES: hypothetical protein [Pseudomonas]|uniref:hypothetical protein n=1 Tax=Pseudomonas TaxID=286 RepID=UPI000CFCF47C|nr:MULTISPECIES: hypothetical protein [Pseudomonas]